MKFISKVAAVIAIAMTFSQQADAQAFPATDSATGGALIVSIWDPVANVSLVYAIPNTTYQDLLAGSVGSFNTTVPQFATIFGGSNPGDIQYQVTAAGLATGISGNDRPALFVTGPAVLPVVANGSVAGTYTNAFNFNGQLAAICGVDPVCTTTDPNAGNFAGQASWGDLSAQFVGFVASTTVGDSLSFYNMTQTENRGRVRTSDPATIAGAGAGGLAATWLLDASGNLVYQVVPIPAAVWLLISGLLGFGVVSRRGQAASA